MPPDTKENLKLPRGSVVRVSLTDFLTYDKVEVKPAPGLNLLIGPNGTGKSTMVCALCLGLGGSPSILGRSTRLPDYIKRDKTEATIEIELSSGDDERNPVIKTIIRHTKVKFGDYFINGQQKDQKEVREFVKRYHIQVDNLCQFLAQDKVVEFARQSKQELLVNTEKAAGSEDLFDQHTKLQDSYGKGAQLRQNLSSIGERKKALEKQLATLEKPFKQYEEFQKRKEKLELLEKKRNLVEYELALEESKKSKRQLDSAKEEHGRSAADMKPLHEQIRKAKDDARRADNEFAQGKRELEQAKRQIEQKLERMDRASEGIESAKTTLQQAKDDFEAKQKQMESVQSGIAALRQKLETLQDQDLKPQMDAIDREMREVNRKIDELDPRETEIGNSVKNEQEKQARIGQQLRSLQNRQQQQLQQLRQMDNQAYRGYMWYTENRNRFRGAAYLPALDIRIPNSSDIKFVEACISRRDLFAMIFDYFEDMQMFLDEMKRQNIRVAAGEVPRSDVDVNAQLPAELRRHGFRDFVCNMFDGPPGLKKYLTQLSALNRVPIGTEQTETNLEEVSATIKRLRLNKYLTPNKSLSISESRYGGPSTVLNQALSDPRILMHTAGAVDDGQEAQLRAQHMQTENEISRLRSALTQVSNSLRESRRRYDELQTEKNQLRQRAGERTSTQSQIDFKENTLQRLRRELPDISAEERKCEEKVKKTIDGKVRLIKEIVDLTETIERVYVERSELAMHRAAYSAAALSCQRRLDEASAALREQQERMERLQVEYNEKRANVSSLLTRLLQSLGLRRDQEIPEEVQADLKDLPDDMEQLDEAIEEQKARLAHAQGVHNQDGNIVNEYRTRQSDLQKAILEETQTQAAITNWEAEVGAVRDEWLAELSLLIETISCNFSGFMGALGCAGEVHLDKPEDQNNFTHYGISIRVKFRDNEPLRELDPQHQSGGERSVSTILYMLALQELSHVPFRCIDEINQGMDPINERKVFEMMTKLLSGGSGLLKCTQYFMLTPKLLHGLSMGEDISVWIIHNGPQMMPNEQWNPRKFIQRRKALDG